LTLSLTTGPQPHPDPKQAPAEPKKEPPKKEPFSAKDLKAKRERKKGSVRRTTRLPLPCNELPPSSLLTQLLTCLLTCLLCSQLLGDFDIDEESGVPVGDQLKAALVKNAGRVIDLFREWDEDGDGENPRDFTGDLSLSLSLTLTLALTPTPPPPPLPLTTSPSSEY
jgi:hypothetical protein